VAADAQRAGWATEIVVSVSVGWMHSGTWTHDGSVALSTPELLDRGLAIDGGANILAVHSLCNSSGVRTNVYELVSVGSQ
jgi:hypothetical protein